MTNKIALMTLMMVTVLSAPAMALELGSNTSTATTGQAVPPAGSLTVATPPRTAAATLNAYQPAAGGTPVATSAPVATTAGTVKVVEPAVIPATPAAAPAAMNAAVAPATADATVPMPAMPDAAAPVVETPAPVLSAAPSSMGVNTPAAAMQPANAVIGAGQTAAEMPSTDVATQPTPAITAPLPPFNGGAASSAAAASPLCAPVAATTAPGVNMPAQQPAVNPPRMIPLSVELADALGIKGFENIKADGPIGFITRDDSGRVMFEGKDLTSNVQTLCASGQPIPAPGMNGTQMASAAPSMAMAPDGSAYSGMPGQKGWRMQPIVDGPSYKYPPKKKRAAPKKEEVKEETLAPVETDKVKVESEGAAAPATAEPAPAAATPEASSDVDSLKSMMRESAKKESESAAMPATTAPAGSSVMTTGAADDATPPAETGVIPAPTTDTSGEGAVGEILDPTTTPAGTK